MPRVQIVYDLDDSSGTQPSAIGAPKKAPAPTELEKKILLLNPNIPKNLTNRGVSKLDGDQLLKPMRRLDTFAEFEQIRTELINEGKLWCDPEFPAESKSVFYSRNVNFEWKRPTELSKRPRFVAEGFQRFDVKQGELGNCWVLAAVASLTMHKELFNRVIPSNQDFDEQYCGAFWFRFWYFGVWKEIIIDDRLPTRNGRLVFMHSADNDEYWSALVEKAYAKLYGSYETLGGGAQSEAFEDFTGGLAETIMLKSLNTPAEKENVFKIMEKGNQQSSLMGCSIESEITEGKLPNGLYTGHAYSVTAARKIKVNDREIGLVRVRNPWGNSEWNGSWSDASVQWNNLTSQDKKNMELTISDDGEFWMAFEDFVANFDKLEICHLGPESLVDDHLTGSNKRRWEECVECGTWEKNVSAGGCKNFLNTFWTNPQFRVTVTDADKDDADHLGSLLVGLMQKDQRKKGLPCQTVGFAIFALSNPKQERLTKFFFQCTKSVRSEFINTREVFARFRLEPGCYVIVPSTFEPNIEATFMLRMFSERPNDSAELDNINNFINVTPNILGITPGAPKKVVELTEQERQVERMKKLFSDFSGPQEAIHALQLKDLLNETIKKEIQNFTGFSLEACRSIVSLYDCNHTGKIEFHEFLELWQDVGVWKNIFKQHDRDHSGCFDANELCEALDATGFKVSNKVFSAVAHRYSDPTQPIISFEDYILCQTRLRNAFENLKAQPRDKNNQLLFSEEDYLRQSIYI